MIKKILIATDGSMYAAKALDYAIDLGLKYDAKLVIANVIQPGPIPKELKQMAEVEHIVEPETKETTAYIASTPVQETTEHREEYRIQEYISGQMLETCKGIAEEKGLKRIVLASEYGDPAKRILKLAKRHNVDLIVLGTRGLGGLKGLMMGSVSDKINHLAKTNCLIVR